MMTVALFLLVPGFDLVMPQRMRVMSPADQAGCASMTAM
jgi:hypothetical protein